MPLGISEFLNLAKQYASALNKNSLFSPNGPTHDWFRSFLQCHTNLSLKKSRPSEKKRASVPLDQADKWFTLGQKILEENELENRPAQIFNFDESGA